MTKTPERIWAAVDSLYPEQDGGTWVSEICSGVEYTRTDHALALVAAALKPWIDLRDESRGVTGFHLNGAIAEWDEFDLPETPDDATAALKARDARIRNEALREVASLVDQKYIALGRYGLRDHILSLITEGQSDAG